MKKIIVSLLILALPFYHLSAKELVIEGVYQGKNLIIYNPFAATGVGFCIYEVTVNGNIITDEINSTSFEIDMAYFRLKKGDPVTVVIKHKEGCNPKIVNPNVLRPASTFTTTAITVDRNGLLQWTTIEESAQLPFYIQQYRWNKWVRVGIEQGKGTPEANTYSYQVHLHSGINKFRVMQLNFNNQPRYSLEAEYNNRLMQPVTFEMAKTKKSIDFSGETDYEIYDYYGKLRLKGFGQTIDISKLEKGDYFLQYDNSIDKFSKK
jgi:hypothetical protein